jgi:serine/threonine-protein kinase
MDFDRRRAAIQRAPGVARRFSEERRILALLEHPGIARLVDGGITADGVPYFAMELVEGEPIDRWCDTSELTVDRRLELLEDVCDVVDYAHRHLVIHRDLKPSNILVTASGQVKLLDFGIAKLLGAPAGDDLTRTGFSVMTPEFAAPEQVRGMPISTATDVYSLGVLLYLLLTGERPYDLRGKSPAEIERIVCEDVPPKPSSKAPPAARRRLHGDLDLIVMTALQKEPHRRYQSPAALAGPSPVPAPSRDSREAGQRSLSAREVRRKTPRRCRGRGAPRPRCRRCRESRTGIAQPRRSAGAEGHRGRAVSRARVRRRGPELVATDRRRQCDGARAARSRASRIDTTLADQPEVQAELRSVVGRVYANLGLYDKAIPLLQRSLAQRRPSAARTTSASRRPWTCSAPH